jgi:AcrR family transcriptional regulator
VPRPTSDDAPLDPMRHRLFEATLDCAVDAGFRLSVEQVAARSGVSRATIYRYFPGGKEQLLSETITWEVARFFDRIGREVADAPDFPTRIERALSFGREALDHHDLLDKVLTEEPEQLMAELEMTMPIVFIGIHNYVRPFLEQEALADGVGVDEAAEYLARMFLTYLGSPGMWDLSDPEQVRRLVRTQFLGAILKTEHPA